MKRYIFSILVTLVVVVISLMPITEVPNLGDIPLMDKWVHFLMYGGLCCVYWFDFYRNGHQRREYSKWMKWIVICPIALGGLMELCQKYLTTYRSGEWLDFVANTVGVLLAIPIGLFVVHAIKPRWFLNSKN